MTVDKARRLEWLRALRRFKYGVKVRAKLGVLDTICQQVAAERRGQPVWNMPQWEHDRWILLLYTSIRDNEFPPELLIGFAQTAEVTFMSPSQQPTVANVLTAVDGVLAAQSKRLRIKFGVFNEET
jgi:hypothetical protein